MGVCRYKSNPAYRLLLASMENSCKGLKLKANYNVAEVARGSHSYRAKCH